MADKKTLGNQAFKDGNFEYASELYTEAIDENVNNADGLKAVLCNRAACSIKLKKYQDCIDDCSAALKIDRRYVKAYYRRAQAYLELGETTAAAKDLKLLLSMDSSNKEAMSLMRDVAKVVQVKAADDSEVNRVLKLLEEGKDIEKGFKMLISLCNDDLSHTMEVSRRGGHIWVVKYIESKLISLDDGVGLVLAPGFGHSVALAVRSLLSLAQHTKFISNSFTIISNVEESSVSENLSLPVGHIIFNDKISLEGLCCLISNDGGEVSRAATSLVLKVLQAWPQGEIIESSLVENKGDDEDTPRIEEVDSEGLPVEKKSSKKKTKQRPEVKVVLFLKTQPVRLVINAWLQAVRRDDCDPETYALSLDALIAFISDMNDYMTQNKLVDTRNEGIDERKKRIQQYRIVKQRAVSHGEAAIECGAIERMVMLLDDPEEVRRSRAFSVLSRVFNATEKQDIIKNRCWPYIYHKWCPGVEYNETEEEKYDPNFAPPPALCRRRAWLEACLLVTKPEIGVWALERQGGMHQLMMLAATQDVLNQEAASEVFCLAASVESATGMLEPIVSSGVLNLLLQSSAPDVRAAAASTMTKLSLKAKALATDSSETTHALNVALTVLKNAVQFQNDTGSAADDIDLTHRLTSVSFSNLDQSRSMEKSGKKSGTDDQKKHLKKKNLASVERAVEVLAALVGRTVVKEELVHGSARVASPMAYMTNLVFDERSTASYGIAHILAALTVTNKELRDRALAEKDITPEQFEQLQELQRVKTKDDNGNPLEEKKEEEDPDTPDMCKRRIQKIADSGGFEALLRLLQHASTQTKLTSATALRQMNVEPAVRGLYIQQGGLKVCHDLVVNDDEDRAVRREAAHAMAKSLVTTNPMMLSEHLRLSALKPLIFLCRDTESSNLMQFEALLSLTNLTSCGDGERDLFISERGLSAVHYLMFSDHLSVRRAATETICNISGKEAFFKLIRNPDNVKLWVAFCEDWDSEESAEALATALGAAGTLAQAVSDEGVCTALLKSGCGECITALLDSDNDGLVHRALVLAIDLVRNKGVDARNHLGEHGVVSALTNVVKNKQSNPTLIVLAKELAETMANVAEESIKN